MAELWYYTNEGVQMDAVSIKELKRLVGEGTLKPTDMVWQDGMPRWIRASSVGELFPDPASALDHYFTNTAGKTTAAAETNTQNNSVKAASAPAATATAAAGTSTSNEKGQTKKASDETERRKPPRHRPDPASTGGGMNWGIMIAIFLGAGVLLTGLVVGVVILIAVSRAPDDGGKDGIAQKKDVVLKDVPKADDGKVDPINDKGLAPRIKDEEKYTLSIAGGSTNSRPFFLTAGTVYTINVNNQPAFARISLQVLGTNNRVEISAAGEANPAVRWSPERDGVYRIQLSSIDKGVRVQSTVTIRETNPPPNKDKPEEKKDDKKDPLDEPLPPDTLEKRGDKALTFLAPGKEISFKFRVKAGYKASFSMIAVKSLNPMAGLIVVKESNSAVLGEDKVVGAVPRVLLDLPNTEIVRVRIINHGKTSIRGTLLYDVSP